MKKQFLSYGIFLLFGILIGYLLTSQKLKTEISELPLEGNPCELPKCYLGKCPAYESVDVNNDSLAESVVIIPTAMTKGAGMLWIIDDNDEVVFNSGTLPGIGFEETEKGFNLIYMSDFEDLLNPKYSKIEYEYKDGKFEEVEI